VAAIFIRLTALNDARAVPIVDAISRVEPTRGFERRESNKQIRGACDYFVVAVHAHDLEDFRVSRRG
jgi:hypothetical protein